MDSMKIRTAPAVRRMTPTKFPDKLSIRKAAGMKIKRKGPKKGTGKR